MRFLIPLTILLALAGCSALEQPPGVSTATEEDVVGGTEGPLPEKSQLHGVPHNPRKQKGADCAPDSLRMVLTYRGKSIANDQVIPRLLDAIGASRGRGGGTTFTQMQQIAVEHYGLPAFIVSNCDLDSLKAAIANKWPPIVSYRVGMRSHHAVVAVGYNDKRRTMSVHDPNYLSVTKIRYDALGGVSRDSTQKLTCLLVLSEGATEEALRRGLEKYAPKGVVRELRIYSRFPKGSG
ncbi:C39 family peptidase [Candidatus Poribacteria bacterium]